MNGWIICFQVQREPRCLPYLWRAKGKELLTWHSQSRNNSEYGKRSSTVHAHHLPIETRNEIDLFTSCCLRKNKWVSSTMLPLNERHDEQHLKYSVIFPPLSVGCCLLYRHTAMFLLLNLSCFYSPRNLSTGCSACLLLRAIHDRFWMAWQTGHDTTL